MSAPLALKKETPREALERGLRQVALEEVHKWSKGVKVDFDRDGVSLQGSNRALRDVLMRQAWLKAAGWDEAAKKPKQPPAGLVCTQQDVGAFVHRLCMTTIADQCGLNPCVVVSAEEWALGTVVVTHRDVMRLREQLRMPGMESLLDVMQFCVITHESWSEPARFAKPNRSRWRHVASVSLRDFCRSSHVMCRSGVLAPRPDVCIGCGVELGELDDVNADVQRSARNQVLQRSTQRCCMPDTEKATYAEAWDAAVTKQTGAALTQRTPGVWVWRPQADAIRRSEWTPVAPPVEVAPAPRSTLVASMGHESNSDCSTPLGPMDDDGGPDGGDVVWEDLPALERPPSPEPSGSESRPPLSEEAKEMDEALDIVRMVLKMTPKELYEPFRRFDTFDVIRLAEPGADLHNRTLPLAQQLKEPTRVFMDYHEATEYARARRMPMWSMDKGKPDNPVAKYFVVADPVTIFRAIVCEDPRFLTWWPRKDSPAYEWCQRRATRLDWKSPFQPMYSDPGYDSHRPQEGWEKVNNGAAVYEGKHNEGLLCMLVDIDGDRKHFPHFFETGMTVDEACQRATYTLMDYLNEKLWDLAGDQITAAAATLESEHPGILERSGWAAEPRLARADWLVLEANRENKISVHMTLRGRAPLMVWRNMVALRLFVNSIEDMLVEDIRQAAAELGHDDLKATTGAVFPPDSPWFWLWGHWDPSVHGGSYVTTFDTGCFKSYQTMRPYGSAKVNSPHPLRLARWHSFGREIKSELDAFLLALFGFVEKEWESDASRLAPIDVFDATDGKVGGKRTRFIFDETTGDLIGVRIFNFVSGGIKRKRDADGNVAGRVIHLRATASGGAHGQGPRLIPVNQRSDLAKMVLWIVQHIPSMAEFFSAIQNHGSISHNLDEDEVLLDEEPEQTKPKPAAVRMPAADPEVEKLLAVLDPEPEAPVELVTHRATFRVRMPKKNEDLQLRCPVKNGKHSKSVPSFNVIIKRNGRVAVYASCFSTSCFKVHSMAIGEAPRAESLKFIQWCRHYREQKGKK